MIIFAPRGRALALLTASAVLALIAPGSVAASPDAPSHVGVDRDGRPAPWTDADPRTRFLDNVDLLTATDGWATGAVDSSQSRPGNQAQHWDGTSWEVVRTPRGVGRYGFIGGVAVTGPDEAWAVGRGKDGGAMVERWDGRRWKIVRSAPPYNAQLLGISAAGPDDVWAIGWSSVTFTEILLHWDGSTWTQVTGLGIGGLTDVHAQASDNVWASGFSGSQPLVERFDGATWRNATPPASTLPPLARTNAISSSGKNDTWVVGSWEDGGTRRPMAARWNGSTWKSAELPTIEGSLSDVHLVSKTEGWAVGQTPDGTLVLHWDGTSWTEVDAPSPGSGTGLFAVDATSADHAVAVGGFVRESGRRVALTLHWDGETWVRR